jgi:hypothetical protein
MIRHPVEGIFVGTIPVAMATIIYMLTQVVVIDHNGEWAKYLAWALWWINVFLAVLSCFGMPIIMYVSSLSTSLPSSPPSNQDSTHGYHHLHDHTSGRPSWWESIGVGFVVD